MKCPQIIDGAKVIMFSKIDEKHEYTAACIHRKSGKVQDPAQCLAICQYDDDPGYYLFGCDESWNQITDTYHSTIEEATKQAEFEYKGIRESFTKKTN